MVYSVITFYTWVIAIKSGKLTWGLIFPKKDCAPWRWRCLEGLYPVRWLVLRSRHVTSTLYLTWLAQLLQSLQLIPFTLFLQFSYWFLQFSSPQRCISHTASCHHCESAVLAAHSWISKLLREGLQAGRRMSMVDKSWWWNLSLEPQNGHIGTISVNNMYYLHWWVRDVLGIRYNPAVGFIHLLKSSHWYTVCLTWIPGYRWNPLGL